MMLSTLPGCYRDYIHPNGDTTRMSVGAAEELEARVYGTGKSRKEPTCAHLEELARLYEVSDRVLGRRSEHSDAVAKDLSIICAREAASEEAVTKRIQECLRAESHERRQLSRGYFAGIHGVGSKPRTSRELCAGIDDQKLAQARAQALEREEEASRLRAEKEARRRREAAEDQERQAEMAEFHAHFQELLKLDASVMELEVRVQTAALKAQWHGQPAELHIWCAKFRADGPETRQRLAENSGAVAKAALRLPGPDRMMASAMIRNSGINQTIYRLAGIQQVCDSFVPAKAGSKKK